MSSGDVKAVAERFFAVGGNEGDLAALDALLAPDFVYHDTMPGIPPTAGGLKQVLSMFFAALSDTRTTIDDLVAEGDLVAVRHTHRARHTGALMGIPPTGRELTVTGIELLRIRGGKVAEFWRMDDDLGLLQQIGAIPAPQAASA